MPLAIIAGLAFLALEIAAIAWLLHWLLAGTVSFLVMVVLIGLALAATAIAWASITAGNRADDEMENFMSSIDGQGSAEIDGPRTTSRRKKHTREAAGAQPETPAARPAPVSL